MNDQKSTARDAVDRFVDTWGNMGALWGVNTSTARVHAFLIASGEAQSLDAIAERLQISRGNASMCLKDLRSWGVAKLEKRPGDRKDYYVTEPDVWRMFFAIARERKRRELDPAVEAVREVVKAMDPIPDAGVKERMAQMQELLTTMGQVAERIFKDEAQARYLFSFLVGPQTSDPKSGGIF